MGTAQQWREYYNRHDDYNNWIQEDGWIVPDYAARALARRVTGVGASVLDVGCGTGMVGLRLRSLRYFGRMIGIDVAEQRLTQARELRVRSTRVYTSVRHENAYVLPWRRARFDGVVSAGVLGLIGPKAFTEMVRVTKQGGTIVAVVGFVKRMKVTVKRYDTILEKVRTLIEREQLILLDNRDLRSGYTGERTDEHYHMFVLRKPAL